MGHEMTRECQCYIWFCSTDTSKETGTIRQRTGHRAASSESPVSHRSVSGKVTSQPLDHGQGSGAEMMSLSQAPGGRCWRCGMAGIRVAVVLQARAGWLQAQQAEQMPKDVLKQSRAMLLSCQLEEQEGPIWDKHQWWRDSFCRKGEGSHQIEKQGADSCKWIMGLQRRWTCFNQ